MVQLMTAGSAMEARIIAARLGSEGIIWELRGSVDGPLAFGPVDVLVDAEGYESARELLLVDDVESSFSDEPRPVHVTTGRDVLWAVLALVVLAVFTVLRMASF